MKDYKHIEHMRNLNDSLIWERMKRCYDYGYEDGQKEKKQTEDEIKVGYDEISKTIIEALSQEPTDAISRDAVIKGIEALKKSPWATDKRGNGFEYLIAEALDVVADLCVKQAPSVIQKSGKWISVSERLPEEYGEYLITWKAPKYPITYIGICECEITDVYDHEHNRFEVEWLFDGYIATAYPDSKVIAWMPLPKPYEPQESEV